MKTKLLSFIMIIVVILTSITVLADNTEESYSDIPALAEDKENLEKDVPMLIEDTVASEVPELVEDTAEPEIPALVEEIEELDFYVRASLTPEISSPDFPDAYIITEVADIKDVQVRVNGNDVIVDNPVQNVRSFVRDAIIDYPELNERRRPNNEGTLVGLVTATVFVEEMYDTIDGQLVVTDSRLLSKNEVDAIGVENFMSLETQAPSMTRDKDFKEIGTLKLTFYCYDYSIGSYLDYDITGRVQWSGFNLIYDAQNNPAIGPEYLGLLWGGNFAPSLDESGVTWSNGDRETMRLCDGWPNASLVWEFQEYKEIPFWAHYVKDSFAVTAITKNRSTGNGNTTQAICKYIHTYQIPGSQLQFTGDLDGPGVSFTLNNTPKQWQIVLCFSNIYY